MTLRRTPLALQSLRKDLLSALPPQRKVPKVPRLLHVARVFLGVANFPACRILTPAERALRSLGSSLIRELSALLAPHS